MGRKVVLILDGASDNPVAELDHRTPLGAADTPNLDALARIGRVGLAATVPPEFTAASDVANLSLLGFDPRGLYTGRAPIEAAAMGVPLATDDVAFRVNTISIGGDETLLDYSAGHITTAEAARVIESCRPLIERLGGRVFPGVQYRHLMLRKDSLDVPTFPPHDHMGKSLASMRPPGVLGELVDHSRGILRNHPVNVARRDAGKNAVDALWPWGQGRSMKLPTLRETYGATGALVSAVDLIRGIGVLAGFDILKVEGVTGYYDTNYAGKARAAIDALKSGRDIVVIHVEAPDEAGHAGDATEKVRALERIDSLIVGPILNAIDDLAILAAPDHPTFVATGLHGSDPVPYLLTDVTRRLCGPEGYSEQNAGGEPVSAMQLLPELMALP